MNALVLLQSLSSLKEAAVGFHIFQLGKVQRIGPIHVGSANIRIDAVKDVAGNKTTVVS